MVNSNVDKIVCPLSRFGSHIDLSTTAQILFEILYGTKFKVVDSSSNNSSSNNNLEVSSSSSSSNGVGLNFIIKSKPFINYFNYLITTASLIVLVIPNSMQPNRLSAATMSLALSVSNNSSEQYHNSPSVSDRLNYYFKGEKSFFFSTSVNTDSSLLISSSSSLGNSENLSPTSR
ncbi:hypothetical protein ACTA71_010422 [Dictyostelium dimigraforme]